MRFRATVRETASIAALIRAKSALAALRASCFNWTPLPVRRCDALTTSPASVVPMRYLITILERKKAANPIGLAAFSFGRSKRI